MLYVLGTINEVLLTVTFVVNVGDTPYTEEMTR